MITDVAVVVPAADEEDEIAGCLESIEVAVLRLTTTHPLVRCHVVVVLDACTDGTAEALVRFAHVSAVLSVARCVGTARRLGAEHAIARISDGSLLIASTDADCRVPVDWLTYLVGAADAGVELVLGTVRPRDGLSPAVAEAWLLTHDLGNGHPHVHAANLAVTAAAYGRIGGWHDLPLHEDVDLVQRAVAARCRIDRTGHAAVRTSSRLIGRTPAGFAAHLRALHEAQVPETADRAS